ncbi:peptidoglycan-binding protein [Plantibacter sp. YIM 135347]|uniref:peptidoglycan-binding protein n=1 Tax=Plantibacter sp. YIM 135347 TaxID=3423919 RepID=UPI003D338C55
MSAEYDSILASEQPDGPVPSRSGKRHRIILAALGAAVVVAIACTVTAVAVQAGEQPEETKQDLPKATAEIIRKTLQESTTSQGKLGYAGATDVGSGIPGTVTGLPAPGSQIGLGGTLFSIDNLPIVLFHGGIPVWRSFESGMEDGPDITQLEQSLAGLGYFDEAPDDEFDWDTKDAIMEWQDDAGLEGTGSIPMGRIVFAPGDVRVSEVVAAGGSQAGPGAPVIKTTGLTKLVTADLKLSDQALGVVGNAVQVRLPGGDVAGGVITSVGVPTEREGDGGKKNVVIPVTITLDDPAAGGTLQEAAVSIDFPSESRPDVLTVPVGALLAVDDTTYGVEVVQSDGSTKVLPVTTGLFAGGFVEISGDGLEAGQKVVVPAL